MVLNVYYEVFALVFVEIEGGGKTLIYFYQHRICEVIKLVFCVTMDN